MKVKKEERSLCRSLPLLPTPIRMYKNKNCVLKREKTSIRTGWFLTICSVFLCIAVLLIAISGTNQPKKFYFGKKMATWLTNLDFMDLSGATTVMDQVSNESGRNELIEGVLIPDYSDLYKPEQNTENKEPSEETSGAISKDPLTIENLYYFDYDAVPEGETPIIPMDLSLKDFGNEYINNSTGLKPDLKKLLAKKLNKGTPMTYLQKKDEPLVLILHTHGTEGYSEEGAVSFKYDGGEIARSNDTSQNVVAVGRVLADTLNNAGVPTIHCEILHDQLQYKDSYARSEETIKKYLEQYPSIQLVIDLHRDSILKSGGELVRPVTLVDGEATAQVMCVVGSNWNGQEYERWEENLSLALQLRESLNEQYENLCRPVFLKGSTYNQELAPYSLLLEIGASGNSLEEAKRAAVRVAEVLAEWILHL